MHTGSQCPCQCPCLIDDSSSTQNPRRSQTIHTTPPPDSKRCCFKNSFITTGSATPSHIQPLRTHISHEIDIPTAHACCCVAHVGPHSWSESPLQLRQNTAAWYAVALSTTGSHGVAACCNALGFQQLCLANSETPPPESVSQANSAALLS